MKGHKDLIWIDRRGVAHGLREYERWPDGLSRSGTTWCGRALDLTWQNLRKGMVTCITCLVRHES